MRATNLYSRITNFVREGDGKIGIFVIFVILSNRYRIYIYITSYPNLVETKRTNIFTFESQEDVLILSFRTFSRDPGHP